MYNDADPYVYDPNEVYEDEEGVPLGRSLEYSDQQNDAPSVKGSMI